MVVKINQTNKMQLLSVILQLFFSLCVAHCVRYEPNWKSLDTRPLPQWYDDAKIGIFIHWGVYSVPSFGTEWFWSNWNNKVPAYVEFMKNNYPTGYTYQNFGPSFRAEFYDPDKWADLFQKSGAKYVVLTSKHHEGYTMWPSKYSFGWNAKDVGPNRDLLGDLAQSIRKRTDLRFGLYHSLYEWFNPLFLADKQSNFKTSTFVNNKVYPEMLEIVDKYKPEIIWSDGEWEAADKYWMSEKFIAWLYNDSPVNKTIVVNDRWGSGDVICHHGDFYTCLDRFNPGVLQDHKWENAMTIDKKSWGYRRNADISDYLSTYELLEIMAQTVSCGGNMLINVGPRSDGVIDPVYEERLLDVGKWLSINGESIYSTTHWTYQNDTIGNTWFTAKGSSVYAITLEWPKNNVLQLERPVILFEDDTPEVTLLGNSELLKWDAEDDKVTILLPDKATVESEWVWVIKITSKK